MLKVAPCTVVRSYIQIFSARWVTTILHNCGATLCELRYNLLFCYLRHCCEVEFLHEFVFCFKIHREVLTEEVLQPYIDGLEIRTDDQRLADVSGDLT